MNDDGESCGVCLGTLIALGLATALFGPIGLCVMPFAYLALHNRKSLTMKDFWLTPLVKWAERTGGTFHIQIDGINCGNRLIAYIELWENDKLLTSQASDINGDLPKDTHSMKYSLMEVIQRKDNCCDT